MKDKDASIVEEYDISYRYRKELRPFWSYTIVTLAIGMSVFHLWNAGVGMLMTIKLRAVHLAFASALIFLLYPGYKGAPKDRPSVLDILMAVMGFATGMYILLDYDAYVARAAFPIKWDYLMGAFAIVLTIEAARRVVGKVLSILAALSILYIYLGDLFPGMLAHKPFDFCSIISQMYLTDEGIYGIALGVSATFVFLFILFGSFLNETGVGKFFIDLALAATGSKPGGPAKVAIIGSALMGTVSGSAVANVATTGTLTIPLMKSIGYRSHFAGAVESVASTGGQIMPPIMGAGAFVMAEFLGISYVYIMVAAIIPALLYYFAVYMQVHTEAYKLGLKGLPKERIPMLKKTLKDGIHLSIPIIVVIIMLLKGFTPLYTAFWGIWISVVTSTLRKHTRITFKGFLHALEEGARSALGSAISLAVVGIVIGMATLTGLGVVVADNIVFMSHGILVLSLALTAIAALFLGMGLPTTACYIIAATVAAPALTKLGINPLSAHMFVFYYAVLSNITPPVCLAAYTGAGIANASPNKVAFTAIRLGIAGFIVPFLFVYSPSILLQSASFMSVTVVLLRGLLGITAISTAFEGYWFGNLNIWIRLILGLDGILLFMSDYRCQIAGTVVWALLFIPLTIKGLKKRIEGQTGI